MNSNHFKSRISNHLEWLEDLEILEIRSVHQNGLHCSLRVMFSRWTTPVPKGVRHRACFKTQPIALKCSLRTTLVEFMIELSWRLVSAKSSVISFFVRKNICLVLWSSGAKRIKYYLQEALDLLAWILKKDGLLSSFPRVANTHGNNRSVENHWTSVRSDPM